MLPCQLVVWVRTTVEGALLEDTDLDDATVTSHLFQVSTAIALETFGVPVTDVVDTRAHRVL